MEEKNPAPPAGGIAIDTASADRLLDLQDGDAALLYLFIRRNGGHLSAPAAVKRTGLSEEQVAKAARRLSQLGLFSESSFVSAPEAPEYSAEDIRRELEGDSAFRFLVPEVERKLERQLTPQDLITLFAIYDDLGLPAEVILLLINWCSEEHARRYEGRRRLTMRTVEKEAYAWAAFGISGLEDAERFIRKALSRRGAIAEVKRALRIGSRPLSPTEERYINGWLEAGFDAAALEEAYDRTILKTHELNWRYMDSIVKNWAQKGLFRMEDIQKGDLKRSSSGGKYVKKQNGTDDGEMERLRRYLKELKEST